MHVIADASFVAPLEEGMGAVADLYYPHRQLSSDETLNLSASPLIHLIDIYPSPTVRRWTQRS